MARPLYNPSPCDDGEDGGQGGASTRGGQAGGRTLLRWNVSFVHAVFAAVTKSPCLLARCRKSNRCSAEAPGATVACRLALTSVLFAEGVYGTCVCMHVAAAQ